MIEGARIVITGGAGFIGTALAERLCEKNDIVLFDNLHRNAISGTGLLERSNVDLVQGDVLDRERLRPVISDADIVIHMASIAGVDTVMKNPTLTMRVSLIGTINALEFAHESQRCQRFVEVSHPMIVADEAAEQDHEAKIETTSCWSGSLEHYQ